MGKDPAIEEVRKTRHEISEKFDHDPRKLVAHYQSLEAKYADQMLDESSVHLGTKESPEDRENLQHTS